MGRPLFSAVLKAVVVSSRWNPTGSNLGIGVWPEYGDNHQTWNGPRPFHILLNPEVAMGEDTGTTEGRVSPPSSDSMSQSPTWSSWTHFLINARTQHQPLMSEDISTPRSGYKPRSVVFLGINIEAEEYVVFGYILVSDFDKKLFERWTTTWIREQTIQISNENFIISTVPVNVDEGQVRFL